MLLLYTEKISPRFSYIVQQLLVRTMGLNVEITTDLEFFIKSEKYKISYAQNSIGDEFFIQNTGFLFEKGIRHIDLYVNYWGKIPYFFCTKNAHLPFDILSASFYLLTRYEEYLLIGKDLQKNFSASDSMGYKYQFLHLPIVDIWAKNFKELLLEKYPNLVFSQQNFQQFSVIEVARAFKHKCKGFTRTLARTAVDVFTLKFSCVLERFKTILGFQTDPFDCYQKLIQFHRENQINSLFFFLLANYSVYDKGISFNNLKYKSLIKYTADYSKVSVLAGYKSVENPKELRKERHRINAIINRSVRRVRASCNRLPLPIYYRNLTDAEYKEDYTMGYPEALGFRAGTSKSFYFYDVSLEVELPILVHSVCFHSDVLQQISLSDAHQKLQEMKQQIQAVGGNFITIFSNEIFDENHFAFYKKCFTFK